MEGHRTVTTEAAAQDWWARQAAQGRSPGAQRHPMDIALGCGVAGLAGTLCVIPDLPPAIPVLGRCRSIQAHSGSAGRRFAKARQTGLGAVLHRRHLCRGQKGGCAVGKTKRGKGTKLMAVADGAGIPVAIHATSASPHEITLIEATLEQRFVAAKPERLIGDRAYDSDRLDAQLQIHGIDMIAPHKSNRIRNATQDGRKLRRYRHRWRVERLFAWLHNFRRLVTRYEFHVENFLGFVHLGCMCIILRTHFWDDF